MTSKEMTLKTGERLTVRQPDLEHDLEALLGFLSNLPEQDRLFMRYDVTEGETLRKRLSQIDSEDHFRIIVEIDGKIVGDATLDRELHGWSRHMAQLRGVVTPEYREKGVATILFRELSVIAEEVAIEKLFAEVMGDNEAVIETLKKAGFTHEATLARFAKDIHGRYHDLHIMTNDLSLVWKRLEDQLLLMDIQMPG